jgi:asparagine synthetase B (glutamine-hydrolysing)
MNGNGFTIEAFFSHGQGVELRYPFRDRLLVEFMLQVPTCQIKLAGVSRVILRRAMADLLPALILERAGKTSSESVARYGLWQAESKRVEALLLDENSVWQEYVDRRWVIEGLQAREQVLLLWFCLACEIWRRYGDFGRLLFAERIVAHDS